MHQNLFTAKDVAQSILGLPGRAISGYPTLYRQTYPEHTILFNIVLCTDEQKLWQGDLDLTREYTILKRLSNEVRRDIYLLEEFKPRAKYDLRPDLGNFLIRISYRAAMVQSFSF